MKTLLSVLIAATLCVFVPAQAHGGGMKGGLFVNLTSNDVSRASMAIMIAHKVLKEKTIPVTIWLNVDAVKLVDLQTTQKKYADMPSPLEMMQAFMKDGGTVMICPMCMKKVGGLEVNELPSGVVPSEMDLWWKAISADDVRVLSY